MSRSYSSPSQADGWAAAEPEPVAPVAQRSAAHVVGCWRGEFRYRAQPLVRRSRWPSPRAERLLLQDAGLTVRGGGRGAGDAAARVAGARALRGPLVSALVA